ncbi:rod shape-determining protein MreD [Pelagivirga sediminicola]|uniref:Rod shape-determining protein MreD n=1 Tax=Pelagivirga sediminicola TaxID=2170575 RepID=A0A2T7G4G2_9RHOB|nr:rod shape-determining protein MreD [Pelagivirga sediminicola]PVA09309.1 rod shape-determining protein MreD [Pelagivirga sediminicola]
MADRSRLHIWAMRAVFAALCLMVIFWRILPLSTVPRGWAGPDLITALSFAWVLRRPAYAPALLIALLVLLADLMFQRPPGLWAALVVLGCEALKARAPGLRDRGFGAEWITVAVMIGAIVIGYRLTLAVLMVPQAPLALSLMQMAMTALCYPLVVLASAMITGVRKARPGESVSGGRRFGT